MLERKFADNLENFLLHEPRKILLVNGARQIGKSYLIRYVGKKLFKHFVEINLKADQEGDGIFKTVRSKEDFYLQLGAWQVTISEVRMIPWFFLMKYRVILT